MLANNLNEILENFDFTDSIVTCVEWADNLIDLIVTVDYYWDIQEDVLKLLLASVDQAGGSQVGEQPRPAPAHRAIASMTVSAKTGYVAPA